MENYSAEKTPVVKYTFECRANKQKYLVDALLRYGRLDVHGLSSMLDILANELHEVHAGKGYLHDQSAQQLALLFLVCFSD